MTASVFTVNVYSHMSPTLVVVNISVLAQLTLNNAGYVPVFASLHECEYVCENFRLPICL